MVKGITQLGDRLSDGSHISPLSDLPHTQTSLNADASSYEESNPFDVMPGLKDCPLYWERGLNRPFPDLKPQVLLITADWPSECMPGAVVKSKEIQN